MIHVFPTNFVVLEAATAAVAQIASFLAEVLGKGVMRSTVVL
jgi:hypothetical protein